MKQKKRQQGFAILITSILLSMAAITFTASMASIQLLDNKIISNYYRNNEAFANAESGINFVLSQFDDGVLAKNLIDSLTALPQSTAIFTSEKYHHQVSVGKVPNSNKMTIVSTGTSTDGSALRVIKLDIDFYVEYPIPTAPLSANGKLNLNDSALLNNGCEGLNHVQCIASGNLAPKMLVSNPHIEKELSDSYCTGEKVGANIIATTAFQGSGPIETIELISEEEGDVRYDWGNLSVFEGAQFAGIPAKLSLQATSLFEATFGIELSRENLDELWNNSETTAQINGDDCLWDLENNVSDDHEIVYIKGDCDIDNLPSAYIQENKTSGNKVFTIGSVENPKLVLIEGGAFITKGNTSTSVNGMLYFIPGIDKQLDINGDEIEVEDSTINLGDVNVNGALLSEYQCSYNSDNNIASNIANNSAKAHFSVRFDKLLLVKLYAALGIGISNSGYRIATGTWRDF